jgi:hypothetical protein
MTIQQVTAFLSTKRRVVASAWLATTLFSVTGPSLADDLPTFRKGMWEFNRTVGNEPSKPLTLNIKKCTNPSEDMKKQNSLLTKAGCTFSPITKSGTSYSFTATCKMGGVSGQSKSVISVDSDSSYKINVESQSAGKTTKELLVAKRIGDC